MSENRINNRPKVGLGILIFNDQNQILLGKRISAHQSGNFGPPGGHIEFGESFEACAARECMEEIGYIPNDIEYLTVTNDVFPEGLHYISIIMTAKMPTNVTPINMEPHKLDSWQWFDADKLPDNLFLTIKEINKLYHFDMGKMIIKKELIEG